MREDIIKKNLEAARKSKKQGVSDDLLNTPSDRVVVIEELVNERLRQDLVEVSKQVDYVCETIADYIKVRSALKVFKTNPIDVRVLTNIGCNFYAQCRIDDANRIYLCIGKDYFLEMELDEAIKMIDLKEKQWTKRLDELQEKASSIKAYIKIALEAMGQLYEADKQKLR